MHSAIRLLFVGAIGLPASGTRSVPARSFFVIRDGLVIASDRPGVAFTVAAAIMVLISGQAPSVAICPQN